MWRILIIITLMALAGCSTQVAVRVRCDRHLVPINVPAATDQHSREHGSSSHSGEGR